MADFRKKVVKVELLGEQWFAILCKLHGRALSDEGKACLAIAKDSASSQILNVANDTAIEEANERLNKWPRGLFDAPVHWPPQVARGRREGPKLLAEKFPIGPGGREPAQEVSGEVKKFIGDRFGQKKAILKLIED